MTGESGERRSPLSLFPAEKKPGPQNTGRAALDKGGEMNYTKDAKRRCRQNGLAPSKLFQKKVTAWFVRPGRLLLFISLNEQADNSNDQNTDLNQICVCHHCQPPFPEIRGQEAPPDVSRGPTRLPLFGSAKVRIAQTFAKINRFSPFFDPKMQKRTVKGPPGNPAGLCVIERSPPHEAKGDGELRKRTMLSRQTSVRRSRPWWSSTPGQ